MFSILLSIVVTIGGLLVTSLMIRYPEVMQELWKNKGYSRGYVKFVGIVGFLIILIGGPPSIYRSFDDYFHERFLKNEVRPIQPNEDLGDWVRRDDAYRIFNEPERFSFYYEREKGNEIYIDNQTGLVYELIYVPTERKQVVRVFGRLIHPENRNKTNDLNGSINKIS